MRGYGLLITKAREAAGLDVPELAERIGQSVATVRRLEGEQTEPSVKQINALVAVLPLSAEELLRGMGVHLNPPAAAKLPRDLVQDMLALDPDELAALAKAARGLRFAREGSGIRR